MKFDTLAQRQQREREIDTKRLVAQTFTRQRDQAQAAIDRLSREIAQLLKEQG